MMKKRVQFRVLAAGLLLCCMSVPGLVAEPDPTIVVEGYLFDLNGKPLQNGRVVLVGTDGQRKMVVSDPTDKEGFYRVRTSKGGAPFNVMYGHSLYGNVVVSRLSAEKDQRVSKVLYHATEKVSVTAAYESISSYEQILFLQRYGEAEGLEKILQQNEIKPEYRYQTALLKGVADSPGKQILEKKLSFIRNSYDVGE